jgi:hypothetical protein
MFAYRPVDVTSQLIVSISIFRIFRKLEGVVGNLQEVGGGRGDWMELARDRDRWRALVGTVRDFRVP